MPTTFRPCAPDQWMLVPPSPRDGLPEGHLACFIADPVAALDLQAFYAPYEGEGRRNPPFAPPMLVPVLLSAYATGTCSSRRIARKLEEEVASRMLAAGHVPAHRTIAECRPQQLAAFHALFVQGVRIAREAGVVQLGTRAIEGTPVKAHASHHKAMRSGRLRDEERRFRAQIAALRTQAAAIDAAEEAAHGPDGRGDELPAARQRRETRLATIAAAKARREARPADEDRQKGRTPDDGRTGRGTTPVARDFGGPPDTAPDNFTDPESRIMNTSAGYDQCDNGQIAVDEASQIIVATGLTPCAADHAEWLPRIAQAHATRGGPPSDVLAEAGYRAEATFPPLRRATSRRTSRWGAKASQAPR